MWTVQALELCICWINICDRLEHEVFCFLLFLTALFVVLLLWQKSVLCGKACLAFMLTSPRNPPCLQCLPRPQIKHIQIWTLVTWILPKKEKNKGLGPACARSFDLFRLLSRMQCVFWKVMLGCLSYKKWRRTQLCCLSTSQPENWHLCLLLLFSPWSALSWVSLWLWLRFGFWFLIRFLVHWCKKQKCPCSGLARKGCTFPPDGQHHSGTHYCGML